MELQKGQKIKLSDLNDNEPITIRATVQISGGEADVTCFGVDGAGKLSDDRYFIFYNQTSSPEGAITLENSGGASVFTVDLSRLPSTIQKLVVTVAVDGGTMRSISSGSISLSGSKGSAEYPFSGTGFQEEKALILCELYCKDGIWRYTVVASGFNGGLEALLAHFGGQAASPVPAPAPAPVPDPTPAPAPAPAKVNLSKITLKKSGETHKIDLSKNSGQLHANLNWNVGKKGLFGLGGKAIDLDLACMFRLKDGGQGVIQALGNSFGSANDYPYILLDQDDRSGSSQGGENMYFKRPELIDFAVIFAYIYEGVPNWRSTDAAVVIKQQGSPDIEIRIDNPDSRDRFCVLASLKGGPGGLEVRREDKFFSGHQAVDQYYGFGFRWKPGRK